MISASRSGGSGSKPAPLGASTDGAQQRLAPGIGQLLEAAHVIGVAARSSQYASAPSEYRSARWSSGAPRTASGGTHGGVPTTCVLRPKLESAPKSISLRARRR